MGEGNSGTVFRTSARHPLPQFSWAAGWPSSLFTGITRSRGDRSARQFARGARRASSSARSVRPTTRSTAESDPRKRVVDINDPIYDKV